MKAVALSREYAPALRDVLLPPPLPPRGRDLLVRIEAVSVNPVDGLSLIHISEPTRPY